MNVKIENQITEEAEVEKQTAKKAKLALVGVKKGAAAAKRTANKIATAPSKLFDNAIYGACYGISYGAVFSSLMIRKILPANGLAIKGFHNGARVARKDFKIREEKLIESKSTVVEG
ncbi:MAG: hypothetical protein CVV06_00115 [Gammaproteobacteria bacterium HGW-Gammaproteobacteria-10]|nr:MAG: hypothetical protein CVV06_00115 [Gammaproteobacteria bacterium HGW-Gammaproteobacteria-10]